MLFVRICLGSDKNNISVFSSVIRKIIQIYQIYRWICFIIKCYCNLVPHDLWCTKYFHSCRLPQNQFLHNSLYKDCHRPQMLALALDTTPDEFLVGTLQTNDAEWKNVSEQLRNMNSRQLSLASSFLTWLSEQKL